MRRSSVIKILTVGFASYVAMVVSVMTLVPDKPEDMDWKDREAYNRVQITKLRLGATRDEVLALLGSPDITEAKEVDTNLMQIMFFRTQHVKADGLTTHDECTPLLFENDKLVAWGEGVFESFKEV
jgi:hypothetical protein